MSVKEERTARAVEYGRDFYGKSFNCAQSTLAGLMEEFFPDAPEKSTVIRVADQFHGGGMKNSYCGGLNGGIMLLDYLYGVDLTTGMPPAKVIGVFKRMNKITQGHADRFDKLMGGKLCEDVHKNEKLMGKVYDFMDFGEVMKFFGEGGDWKCKDVVESGIRLVCDFIMDDDGNIIDR